MGHAEANIAIDRPADDVWALIRDFGGIGWMPGVDDVKVSGDTRTLSMLGMEIVEELRSNDDATRRQVYGIVGGGLPVEHHEGTITVTPQGGGCTVTWAVDVQPDSLTDIMHKSYQGALGALRDKLQA